MLGDVGGWAGTTTLAVLQASLAGPPFLGESAGARWPAAALPVGAARCRGALGLLSTMRASLPAVSTVPQVPLFDVRRLEHPDTGVLIRTVGREALGGSRSVGLQLPS